MINYKSTRGDKKIYSFSEAVLKGIADDGGLFVPEKIPLLTFEDLKSLSGKSYQEKAFFLLNLFEPDLPKYIVRKMVLKAYSKNFDDKDIAPLKHLKENQYILELWHGPTASFKDMALQVTPLFFEEAIKKHKGKKYLILVATSGDTGKAALEGFKDKDNISIIVFYPDNRVSNLQKLQMATQEGSNVCVFALKGDFDETQKIVKDIFNDKEFNLELAGKYKTVLSSANSINWGRLLPQIIYHVTSYLDLGEEIDIAVPTGNFGNILGAFYAKKMGLPVRKLICASNANNVLTRFLSTGIYDIRKRKLLKTPSPSMDILVAGNIERLLYELTLNSKLVSKWMSQLKTEQMFEVDSKTKKVLQNLFYAGWVSNKDCLDNIKKIYKETGYLMDPHTSVGQLAAQRYIEKEAVRSPVVICSTAHWSKFATDSSYTLPVPESISSLKTKKIRFKRSCEAKTGSVKELITSILAGKR